MSLKSDFLSVFPSSHEDMRMNLFTLSFEGKIEDQYKAHEMKREMGQRRIGLIIAVIIYGLFGVMDLLIMPEIKNIAWFIRFAIFIPLTLTVFIASYWEKLMPWMEALISVVIIASGLGHLVILSYAPPEVRAHYYMGLVIFMLFSLTILRTDFVKSVISGFVIFLGYVFFAIQIEKALFVSLYTSVFILLSCWVICAATCYLLEYKSRSNYYLNQIIHTGRLPKLPGQEVIKEKTVVKTVESPVNKLYENLTDFVWFMTRSGELKYLSPSVKDFIGYEPEDLEGKRAQTVYSTNSYQVLESQLALLGQSTNRLNLVLEYKTRAGLIKDGHAVIVRYQDKRMGDGYLGSTRVDEEALSAKGASVEVGQSYDIEAFEKEKEKLHKALLAAQEELTVLKGIEEMQLLPVQVDLPVTRDAEVVGQLFDGFKRDLYQEQNKSIERLMLKTRQLEEKFSTQSMKKYDLETYLQETTSHMAMMEKRMQLQELVQDVFVKHLTGDQDTITEETVLADKVLQKSFVALSPIFKGTQFVIEFDCPEQVSLRTQTGLLKSVIQSLIALSILYGFKSTNKGVVELKVEVRDAALVMHYLDDGDDYDVTAMDQVMNKLFSWDHRNPYIFNMLKELVEVRLKGTLGFDLSESRNAVRIVLPLES
jgi:PAS domain S-box-containing protein